VRRLIQRVEGLLRRPRQELPLTLAESGAPKDILPYVLMLAAPAALALFLADGLFGAWYGPTEIFHTVIPGSWARAPGPAAGIAVSVYVLLVGAWAGTAAVMSLLAPRFGGRRDDHGAAKAAACALTPMWLSGASLLFLSVPYLNWLPDVVIIAGIAWSVFVGKIAVPLHMGTPEAKAAGHALVSLALPITAGSLIYLLVVRGIWAMP
jgi:Yip1 domain